MLAKAVLYVSGNSRIKLVVLFNYIYIPHNGKIWLSTPLVDNAIKIIPTRGLFLLAAPRGLEPRYQDPESCVLPIRRQGKT